MTAVVFCLTIPATIAAGVVFWGHRQFYFIALLIILQTMLPFLLRFERRKPQARELVILAVLVALAVAGRSAFVMLPQFKPVAAIVIIAGVAFGGESGFLVGAVTMFVSNIFFGHGPWTPWQMFAMGMVGLLAGLLFGRSKLTRWRTVLLLCVFGGLATFVIFGGVMDFHTLIMAFPRPTWEAFWAVFGYGVPMNALHAGSTVVFLALLAKPLLGKLERVKTKYGISVASLCSITAP
ncbi:MAG: ECF transporter S component [Oscillospiraceae bacterium]|nr:ECF transporter S component [Oscillospiraceae bacterium]